MQIQKTNEQREIPDQHRISTCNPGMAKLWRSRGTHGGGKFLFHSTQVPAGSNGLATLQGSSGHAPSATLEAGSSAVLPWPWCPWEQQGRSPCPQQLGHLGRGALAPGAGTAAGATHTRLPFCSLAMLAEWEAAKPSWDSLVQQDGPQETHILALIWDLFSHCSVFVT